MLLFEFRSVEKHVLERIQARKQSNLKIQTPAAAAALTEEAQMEDPQAKASSSNDQNRPQEINQLESKDQEKSTKPSPPDENKDENKSPLTEDDGDKIETIENSRYPLKFVKDAATGKIMWVSFDWDPFRAF